MLKNGVVEKVIALVIVELGVRQALLYCVSALSVDTCNPHVERNLIHKCRTDVARVCCSVFDLHLLFCVVTLYLLYLVLFF